MKSSRVAAVGTALVGLGAVEAATPAGAYVGPGVTAGTPIAANYTGPLRPQVHYSPPKVDVIMAWVRFQSLMSVGLYERP